MGTLIDDLNLYSECDILLSADGFENLEIIGFKRNGLFLSHYLSTPALSWDRMLNMTKVELELFTDS